MRLGYVGIVVLGIAVFMGTGCAATASRSPVQVATESWVYEDREARKLVTEHFDIYSTLADRGLEEALPVYLEAAHEQYGLLLPPAKEGGRLATYVFRDRGQWERFTKRRFPRRYEMYRKIASGAYAEGNMCVAYYIKRMYTLSILAHEGMHQYFANHFDVRLPAWLNEGLATYCESFDLPGGVPHFTPGQNSFRLNSLRNALSLGGLLPLRDILATNAGRVVDQGRSGLTRAYYAQVWALVTFLRHGADGKYAAGFDRMMQAIVDGDLRLLAQAAKIRAPQPARTSYGEGVFRAFITEDLSTLEEEFNAYLYELCGFRKQESPTGVSGQT